MQKYGGSLVHRSCDAYGVLEVIDHADMRSLHFGTPHLQSRMRRGNPIELMVAYTRYMLAALLFLDNNPGRILLLGLGGGSLAKFLLLHYPHCRIQVVETRATVIDLAHSYFHLPHDPRLQIHISDAGLFLKEHSRLNYDLILVDIFDAWGPSETLANEDFFCACRAVLRETGIASVNLWYHSKADQARALDRLNTAFDRHVLNLPVPDKDNHIVLAFARSVPSLALQELRQKVRNLEEQFAIGFPSVLRALRRHNSDFL